MELERWQVKWADEGIARVVARGLELAEVVESIFNVGFRVDHLVGDEVLYTFGMAPTGKLIAACLNRTDQSPVFYIQWARPMRAAEVSEWSRRVK